METLSKTRRFAVIVAAFGLILGISTASLGVLQYYYSKPKKRELTLRVISAEELTKFGEAPYLEGNFTYYGAEVERLWRVETSVFNSGSSNLIGKGVNKHLVEDSARFKFREGIKILESTIKRNEPNADVTKSLDRYFFVRFTQWRSKEELLISFLVSGKKQTNLLPIIEAVDDREIVGGQIVVECPAFVAEEEKVKGSFIEYLPRPLVIVLKVINTIVAVGFSVIIFVLFGSTLSDYGKIRRFNDWEKLYGDLYEAHISKLGDALPASDIPYFKIHPDILPERLWNGFEGTKPPPRHEFFGKTWKIFLFDLTLIIIALTLALSVLNFIPL